MQPCPFCSIAVGRGPARMIFEDNHTVAFFPLVPATLGHTLVVPRTHAPDLWAIAPTEAGRLLATALRVGASLRDRAQECQVKFLVADGIVSGRNGRRNGQSCDNYGDTQ